MTRSPEHDAVPESVEGWPNHLVEAGTVDIAIGSTHGFEVLDVAQAVTLRNWCSTLIPASRTRPGGGDISAAEYIDATCTAALTLRPMLLSGIEKLDEIAKETSGQVFSECSAAARAGVLSQFERTHPEIFTMVRDFTYEAYYGHPVVLAALEVETGWRGTAPSTGSSMPPFDESSLARVRSLPTLYRRVPGPKLPE